MAWPSRRLEQGEWRTDWRGPQGCAVQEAASRKSPGRSTDAGLPFKCTLLVWRQGVAQEACSHRSRWVVISLTSGKHLAFQPLLSTGKEKEGSKGKELKIGFPAPQQELTRQTGWHKCPAQLTRSPHATEARWPGHTD